METPPLSVPGEEFPLGDIVDGEKFDLASKWLEEIEVLEYASEKRKALQKRFAKNREWFDRVLTDTYGVAPGQENIQKAGIGLAYLLATQSAMLRMDHEYTADGM